MFRAPSLVKSAASVAGRSYASAPSSYLTNFAGVQTTPLNNLVRVSTSETGGKFTSVGVFVNAGSAFETTANNGVSNLIANIAENETDVESGVTLSTYINREQIGIVAHATSGPDAAVKSLKSAMNAIAEGKGIERQKTRILNSLRDLDLTSHSVVYDHLHSVAFQNTPLSLPLTGTTSSISGLNGSSVSDFVKTHFTGNRVVVAGAGNVGHSALVDAANNAFSQIQGNAEFDFGRLPEAEYTGSMVSVRDDDVTPVTIAIAMKGLSHSHKDYFTLKVIEKIIGNWNRQYGSSRESSLAFANNVQEEGLNTASALHTFNLSYHTTGLFGVLATTTRDTVEDLSYHVFKEFNRIASTVTSTEVNRAKQKLKRELLSVSYGDSLSLCKDVGLQTARIGRYISPAEIGVRIDEITRSCVSNLAGEILTDQCPAIAATGSTIFLPDYNQMRGWTYWNRL